MVEFLCRVGADTETKEDEQAVESVFPCDTLVGLQLLRSQFPDDRSLCSMPIALKSQIYSVINDRTQADKEMV